MLEEIHHVQEQWIAIHHVMAMWIAIIILGDGFEALC